MADEPPRPDVMSDPAHSWAFMFRCTMEARRVIAHALAAVQEFGGSAIGTEHLLLGLLEPDVRASKHLTGLPVSTHELRRHVVSLLGGAKAPDTIEVPLSGAAKQVMNVAWAEAETRGHAKIQSTHLLLGILAAPEAPAARLLVEQGLTTEHVAVGLPGTDPDLEDA